MSIQTGAPGVDNSFGLLVPQIEMLAEGRPLRDLFAAQVDTGVMLYAIELRGVDHPTDDPSVEVIIHRARAIDGLRSMGGIPAPDQRVALEPISSGRGAIRGGWLEASLSEFEVAFLASPDVIPVLPLVLRSPRVRFFLSCDGAGLARIELGGETYIHDVARTAEEAFPGFGDTVRSVLYGIADMEPQAGDPSTCEALSFAYTFEGVPARR